MNFLPAREMTDKQIMADVLNRLVNSGYWGKGHQNIDQLVGWMKEYVKENGARIKKAINRLRQQRLIGRKKGGKTIYLNRRYIKEIYEFIDKHLTN
ncbi:hypothetical protein ISS40_11015 [Candidatus Bathyarchaeota archaeon]|nr:hypothetical protein [Candidatus Bathyarchaeota archaeon]